MQVGIIDNDGYEHANRVYMGGKCPSIQSRDFKDPIKVVKRMKKTATIIGEMDNSDGTFESANRIYDVKASAPTIPTSCGGGHTPKIVKLIGGVGEENEFGSQFRQQNRVYDNKELSVSMTSAGINGLYPRKVETMDRTIDMREEDGIVYVKDLFENEEKPDKEKTVEDYLITAKDGEKYGIFKLSYRECLRLQNVRDSDIDKMAYTSKEIDVWRLLCDVKSTDVTVKRLQSDSETYAFYTTKDFTEQVETSTEWMKLKKDHEKEKSANVRIVIEKLGKMVQKECATDITKCLDCITILYGLTKELEEHHTAIIGLASKDNTNIGKFMRITWEENLNPMRLFIILTVLKQIIESRTYTSIPQRVNISGRIITCENLKENMGKMLISDLKMESITTNQSPTQMYKQAGNSICVSVLVGIFSQLNIKGVKPWNQMTDTERYEIIKPGE